MGAGGPRNTPSSVIPRVRPPAPSAAIELTATARLRDGRSITIIANDFADADERLSCAVARELRVAP
jgi:hypothetical protein